MSESSPLPPTPKQQAKPSDGPGSGERTNTGLQRRFVDALAWLITSAWISSFIMDATVVRYDPPPTVHGLMMLVAGAAFASSLLRKDSSE